MRLVDVLNETSTKPLIAGREISIETDDGYCFELFWHSPSLNLGWYPILQIADVDKSVFWQEGPENEQYWNDVIMAAIDWLRRNEGRIS